MKNLLTAFWVLTVFTLMFFWLPKKFLNKENKIDFITSNIISYIYAAVITLFSSICLSKLHLFNWLTLLLSYFIWPTCYWLAKNFGQIGSQIKVGSVYSFLHFIDFVEFADVRKNFYQYLPDKFRRSFSTIKQIITEDKILKPDIILALTLSIIIFSFLIILLLSQPFQELRLFTVEGYETLLESWQILSSDSVGVSKLSSSFIAVVANISATNPMHVVRFLSPIFTFLLILATTLTAWRLSNYKSIGLVSCYALVAYLVYWPGFANYISKNLADYVFWQKVVNNFDVRFSEHLFGGQSTLVTIFLLLSIITWSEVAKGSRNTIFKESLVASCICLFFLGLYCPLLLIPVFLTMAILLIWQPLGLLTLSISLVALFFTIQIFSSTENVPKELTFTVPIALALFCGAICQVFSISKTLADKFAYFVVILLASITLNPFSTKSNKTSYLEYDVTARKTLEIAQQFPKKQWQIIAPTEQLASSYGYGWYQDLAEFVDKYQNNVNEPGFEFSFALTSFIFVEKKPFATFEKEPLYVPFSTLTDTTYRHYRSLAGRASLEQQALTLCETYSKFHPEVKIYYEDEFIRIYLIPKLKTRLVTPG
jgi:hypothetical protein